MAKNKNMDIKDIRREYLQDGLHREDLDKDPIKQFEKWLSFSCEQASDVIIDPTAMVLSTVSKQGRPSSRIVLLKSFDEKGFVFYTNLESRKAKEIDENENVSLLFPWNTLERQIIIGGKAQRLTTAENLKYFLSRPKDSQIAAWASKQSHPVKTRKLLEAKFHEIKNKFENKDMSLPSFWGGFRVIPDEIEFWQGGAFRLHDRFMYRKSDDDSWSIERLAP